MSVVPTRKREKGAQRAGDSTLKMQNDLLAEVEPLATACEPCKRRVVRDVELALR
jgi:hypothetical protein